MTRVVFLPGRGGLPKIAVTTAWSTAEIYLHGAHVTHFQRQGEPRLLFLSEQSRFETGVPIRGGIPIIFPWFGKPPDKPGQHGFARNRSWTLQGITTTDDGAVTTRFSLPPCPELSGNNIVVEYEVTLSATLTAELIVTNNSPSAYVFENCLHTYLAIGDIHLLRVAGLHGEAYLDALDRHQSHREAQDAISFAGEVDRIYVNAPQQVEIHDSAHRRIIRVDKAGSNSTVVWNPWIAKAKAMSDFGDDEYQRMVCVESGNVVENQVTLTPGATASLRVTLSSKPTA